MAAQWIDIKLSDGRWARVDLAEISAIYPHDGMVGVAMKNGAKLNVPVSDAADLINRTGGTIGGDKGPTMTTT